MANNDPNDAPRAFSLRFHLEEAVLLVLLILSVTGVGVTNFSPDDGYWYWTAMVFVFAIAAMITGRLHAKKNDHVVKKVLVVQAFHWLGTLLAMIAIFSMQYAGVLDAQATGLIILLILALATFIDGIRLGWRFSLVGVFLGVTAVLAAHVEEFAWITVLLAVFLFAFSYFTGSFRTRKRLKNDSV
ncbi:MAG: hypothetical protein V3V31_10100 [Methylococcales bacterium]